MKKGLNFISLLMLLSMLLIFGGCAGNSSNSESNLATTTNVTSQASNSSESVKSLVVYFSWSGNTQKMAQWIADESGSDIYSVTPKEPYGDDYNACTDRAKNELDNGIRPELSDLMDKDVMAQYDTIYVGFPIWWYDLPMPMTAFLENYDLSGKTIIPFFSHNGSSSGAGSLDTLKEICKNADVMTDDALSISGNSVESSESEIRDWVKSHSK